MNDITALLGDYTFQVVGFGSMLLGITSGVLGSFAVERRQSLLGDAVSHAALPGVVLAFIITGSKSPGVLLTGALISGLLSALLMLGIVKYSRVKFDGALALVMSVFFGLGVALLTYVQKLPDANQAGLSRFIYGQASTMLTRDVAVIAVCGTALLLVIILFWKELKLFAFDCEFAKSAGYSTGALNVLLSLLIVLSIVIGLQTVGVVLMSAMLISPAVASRQWTDRFSVMVILAAFFGAFSGVCGVLISSVSPGIPTGPAIVVCISGIAVFSLIFAPHRGIVAKAVALKRIGGGR